MMRMKMEDGWVFIKDADSVQTAILKSWGRLKWDRKTKLWRGQVSMELLNKLRAMVLLPAPIEAERQRLNAVQAAVDKERTLPSEQVKPLVRYPVTRSLYTHQTRAANMALLTFGIVDPKEVLTDGEEGTLPQGK